MCRTEYYVYFEITIPPDLNNNNKHFVTLLTYMGHVYANQSITVITRGFNVNTPLVQTYPILH